MSNGPNRDLSRRERQIMDIVHALGRATAAEVHQRLPNPPGYSSVRTLLRLLERKGRLGHTKDGQRYVYHPLVSRAKAGQSAFRHLLHTFFAGSAEDAMATLLEMEGDKLTNDDLDRLAAMIEDAKRKER